MLLHQYYRNLHSNLSQQGASQRSVPLPWRDVMRLSGEGIYINSSRAIWRWTR